MSNKIEKRPAVDFKLHYNWWPISEKDWVIVAAYLVSQNIDVNPVRENYFLTRDQVGWVDEKQYGYRAFDLSEIYLPSQQIVE